MKEWINKPHNNLIEKYYRAKFSFVITKDFTDKSKMEEWVNNTKKKYSFNYEPEIKVFKKINSGSEWDTYEEVL